MIMGALFSYTIAAGIILMTLYIVYKWLLSSLNQPRFNRVVLLLIYAISFIMPVLPRLTFPMWSGGGVNNGGIEIAGVHAQILANDAGCFDWLRFALLVYGLGMSVIFIRTVVTAVGLYRLIKSGRKLHADNYTVVYIDRRDIAPFSWGRYIVMNDSEDAAGTTMIESHELAHIRACHFIDLIISQFACIVLWYNPAAWLLQTELKAVHEYEADESVILSGCDARAYQLYLVKKAVGQRFPSLANSLNHSKLKKRITMMYSKKTSAARKSRVLALVPAAAFGLMLLNVPTVSEAMTAASTANMGINSISANKVTTNSIAEQIVSASEEIVAPEQLPEFEGGMEGLISFLSENVKYPQEAIDADVQGYVLVQFTVTKTGEVEDIAVKRSVHPSLDAEAIRVIKATSGKWTPGKVDGQNVSVQYSLPVSFKTK